MNTQNEIKRRDKKIEDDKRVIKELSEEIVALRQLLDCAAANIALLAYEQGGIKKLSAEDVKEALGRFTLSARRDNEGNYLIEVCDRGK